MVADSVLRADALSTAALVLGPTQGCELLASLPETEGVIVAKDGERSPPRLVVAFPVSLSEAGVPTSEDGGSQFARGGVLRRWIWGVKKGL